MYIEEGDERHGLFWPRLFGDGDPYSAIKWEDRTAKITNSKGKVIFEQNEVEVPDFWSQTATDIVASKFFRGRLGFPERERSAKQMIDRVVNVISSWGLKDGYFNAQKDCENFRQDLKFLLINQFAAFNSPVWFNVGVREHPQCSACFILSVEDNMKSILEWYRNEGWIFKFGSGSGINLSKLRSSKETLSFGGKSSGPVSFMKGADGVANSIRSGGTTRRAAKIVILNVDHPDIKDFIYCKKIIEDMIKILEASGVTSSIDGDLFNSYTLLPYQNANNTVRVTDEFMKKLENDGNWDLKAVTTGEVLETLKASQIMDWIAEAVWYSGDPGMQFDTTINTWHTCPNAGRIDASNPCSEFMFLNDSACNLASFNLLKFLFSNGTLDVETLKNAVATMIVAQEIIVGNSSYPTDKITKNSLDYRALGLGYANLGSLLMNLGLPYDSDEGRAVAAEITSIISSEAYKTSAKLAAIMGAFAGYEANKEPMIKVIEKHCLAAENTKTANMWKETLDLGKKFGFRNAQVTLLAPTGTISFLMDCDTTGIEPELALVKYKKLVGGGTLKLTNGQVPSALRRLGYSEQQVSAILLYLMEKETVEGAPDLKLEHLSVFDCSFEAPGGARSISYMGHLKMMAAVQSLISGAESKTVNLPSTATTDDIKNTFIQAWKMGLKSVAIYRYGCKSIQPVNVSITSGPKSDLIEKIDNHVRVKLPDDRESKTHKFSIAGHEGYLITGLYPDTKKPGETFIVIAKEGSTVSGLFDVIATLISICLQSGVPLKTLVKKFKDVRFEPSGFTKNPGIRIAKSIIDYIFRYLGITFLSEEDKKEIFGSPHVGLIPENNKIEDNTISENINTDAPVCGCGTMMFRAGSCYTCPNCFATTGVCN